MGIETQTLQPIISKLFSRVILELPLLYILSPSTWTFQHIGSMLCHETLWHMGSVGQFWQSVDPLSTLGPYPGLALTITDNH